MLPSDANGCEFEKSFLLNEQKKKTKIQKPKAMRNHGETLEGGRDKGQREIERIYTKGNDRSGHR